MTIHDGNFCIIQGWMRTRLGLKGIDLMIYAIIYGFSQDGESEFSGSLEYLQAWTGYSKGAVVTSLRRLTMRGLVEKREERVPSRGACKKCFYTAIPADDPRVQNLHRTDGGRVQNLHSPGAKSAPVYNDDNKDYINNKSSSSVRAQARNNGDTVTHDKTNDMLDVIARFEAVCGGFPKGKRAELAGFLNSQDTELVLRAVELADQAGDRAKNWRYVSGILKNWSDRNIRTVEEMEKAEAVHQKVKAASIRNRPGSKRVTRPAEEASAAGDWMRDAQNRPRRLKKKGERHDQKES